MAQDVCPRGRAGSGRQPRGSARVSCVHVCMPPGADVPQDWGCVCVCVCTRAKGAARGARLCVCENPAPTSAGSSALGVRAGGSSACTALRGVWKCVSAGVCVWDACVEAGVRVNTEPPRRLCS